MKKPDDRNDGEPTVRVQIDVPAQFAEALDSLSDDLGHGSRRETIVVALTHLLWMADEIRQGRRVGSLDRDGTRFHEVIPMGAKMVKHYRSSDRHSEPARPFTPVHA